MPTAGNVRWSMSSSWPLGFGGGFQGSMTGYDNILFIARIYQRHPQHIIERVESFAQLGTALSIPVKHYSSGMRARLAFGLSIAIEFECYLIDEIVAVGDALFTQKCKEELFARRADRAFVIASHDLEFLRENCNEAIVIESGRAKLFRDINVAIEVYTSIWEDHYAQTSVPHLTLPLNDDQWRYQYLKWVKREFAPCHAGARAGRIACRQCGLVGQKNLSEPGFPEWRMSGSHRCNGPGALFIFPVRISNYHWVSGAPTSGLIFALMHRDAGSPFNSESSPIMRRSMCQSASPERASFASNMREASPGWDKFACG